jgi:hypothetical protein
MNEVRHCARPVSSRATSNRMRNIGPDRVTEQRNREFFFKVLNLSAIWFLGSTAAYFSHALFTVWFPVQIVLAWLVADLLSGSFHWFIERILSRFSRFDRLVSPFQEHHARSLLEDETWYMTMSHIGILAFAFLAGLYVVAFPPLFVGFWIWLVAISYMNPAIHRLCHRPPADRPRWFAAMQEWGLVLTAEHHAVHHAQLDRNYCLVNGHADRLLNRLTARA